MTPADQQLTQSVNIHEEKPEMTTTFTVPAPKLRQALQTASAFKSDDDTLPVMAGVHMAPVSDLVSFTATNRFIASHETLKIEGEAFAFTIPDRVVTSLISVLSPTDQEPDPWDEMEAQPIEPFDLATFLREDDGKVTVRLLGRDTIEIVFEPVAMGVPEHPADVRAGGSRHRRTGRRPAFQPGHVRRSGGRGQRPRGRSVPDRRRGERQADGDPAGRSLQGPDHVGVGEFVTPAETLAAAAALIREQHGEGCPDHRFWAATADLLDEAQADARAVEETFGLRVLGDRTERPLKVARAYLDMQGVASCAS